MVGPFCFIDHMGPSLIGPDRWLDVDQHPHIGLCTLTYLLEGEVEHQDSTGARQIIKPGSVNLMVSGKGVAHTERTPKAIRENGITQMLHGYQVWIALPKEQESIDPFFEHTERKNLPNWQEDDLDFTLIIGTAFGHSSPVTCYSPVFMIDIKSNFRSTLSLQDRVEGEIALVVIAGRVWADDQEINPGQMLISKIKDICLVQLDDESRILAFGGEPLPEERFMYWNFISSSKSVLEQAKKDWAARKFTKVAEDETYIPLP